MQLSKLDLKRGPKAFCTECLWSKQRSQSSPLELADINRFRFRFPVQLMGKNALGTAWFEKAKRISKHAKRTGFVEVILVAVGRCAKVI